MNSVIISQLRKALIIILLFIYPSFIYSQLSDWVNYVDNSAVYNILNEGEYLWLATNGGLVKFNKITKEKIIYDRSNSGLPENKVINMSRDHNGKLWVTTDRMGVCAFDENQCKVYNTSNSGLPNNQYCNAIIVDKDNAKWIGTNGYLSKFDGINWESWRGAPTNTWVINTLNIDEQNTLWIGGIFILGSLAKLVDNEFQYIDGIGTTAVNNMEFDKDGNLWLATTDNGLVKYDGKKVTTYNTENSNIPNDNVYDVKIDESGNFWLACGRILVKFDGTAFTQYETSLIDVELNWIFCLEVDGNTIWLGTRQNGLIKFSDGKFESLNISNSSLITNTILFDSDIDTEGNVRIGTEYNLVMIDKDNNWHSFFEKTDNPTGEPRINAVATDPLGYTWVVLGRSDTCVVKMQGDEVVTAFTRKNTPLFKSSFIQSDSRFQFDKKGNTWLANRAGLYKYDGSEWTLYTPKNSPIRSYTVFNVIFDNDGNMWGGTGDRYDKGCLFKYDGTDWEIFTPEDSGLPTSIIAALALDSKNNLWIHCRDDGNVIGKDWGGGLTKYDGKTWTTYNTRNSGIPSNSILDITIDKNDDLWLATYGGVGITHYDGKTWTCYNTENSGIAYNEVSKITLDYGRDLVWLNHLDSRGISTAKLNWGSSIESNGLNNQDEGFVIYNDATRKELHFQFNDNINPEKLELFDMSGRLIASRTLETSVSNDFNVSLSELNIRQNGIYLVKLITPAQVYTRKFMVK